MKLGDHVLLGLVIVNVKIEPFVELLGRGKNVREEEVEQGPQFVQVVLQGSSGQKETECCAETSDCLAEHGGLVLETMGLVNDQVAPGKLLERPSFGVAHLIRGDADVPLPRIV